MFAKKLQEPSNLTDQMSQTADEAIRTTQLLANEAVDGLAHAMQDARTQAVPMLNRASEQVGALAQRGVDSVRQTSQQLRDRTRDATDGTVQYIKDEPVKAMLIAAATGATLMALVSLISRSGRRG
ncbi:MAG TPA: hypothetical protein PK497_01395 [Burkholderiaceae bacterium]|nr:hypothetical protein [Burkholderiaceae bacterium]